MTKEEIPKFENKSSEKPEEEKKKEIIESSFEDQINECNNRIEGIADRIDLLADQYKFGGNEFLDLGYEPSKERLSDITDSSLDKEEIIEKINVFSAQLAAKKEQLKALERKLDEKERAE